MARSVLRRRDRPREPFIRLDTPGIAVVPTPFWAPAKGVDFRSRSARVTQEYASAALNLLLRDGIWQSRPGITRIGGALTSVVATMKFITSRGVVYLIAFRYGDKPQYWTGSAWLDLPGSYAIIGTASDRFTWTTFGDRLVFSDGVSGLFEFDPSIGEVKRITEGPSAKHLTTFNGRVVASSVRDPNIEVSRIRWSVKNNHLDWDGLGSGFEDLKSTPGGSVDQQGGVYPLDDTSALVLRTQSLWIMTATGLSDVPFRFSRLIGGKGSESPYSAAITPGGVVFVGTDNITLVNLGEYRELGDKVKDKILGNATSKEAIIGTYVPDSLDPRAGEYLALVPESDATYLYRLTFPGGEWTRHKMAVNPLWIGYARGGKLPLTIDGLTAFSATIDGLSATFPTIDSMAGAADDGSGLLFATATAVARENPAVSQDNFTGTPVDAALEVVTGAVSTSPLHFTNILEATLVYESGGSQTLIFEYSTDNGATWTAYSQEAIAATTKRRTLNVRKTVEAYDMLVRVRATTLGTLKIHGFLLNLQQGKPVQDGGSS